MEKAKKNSQMETNIMVSILSENHMEKVVILGPMEILMRALLKKGLGQVGESWREETVKFTKGTLKMTWNTDKADSTLNPVNHLKVYSRRERE